MNETFLHDVRIVHNRQAGLTLGFAWNPAKRRYVTALSACRAGDQFKKSHGVATVIKRMERANSWMSFDVIALKGAREMWDELKSLVNGFGPSRQVSIGRKSRPTISALLESATA